MQGPKTALVCMSDSMYRVGLASVLKESGLTVSVVGQPNEINREAHRKTDYLILGNIGSIDLADLVLNCIGKAEPVSMVLVVKMLKLSELDKLKSLGVSAILSTDTKPLEMVRALVLLPEHWIVNTGIVVPDGVGSMHLTNREWEVLSFLANGSTVKVIAQILNLSAKTVEAHKFNLMGKLEVHNKAELVLWYVANKHLWQTSSNGSL